MVPTTVIKRRTSTHYRTDNGIMSFYEFGSFKHCRIRDQSYISPISALKFKTPMLISYLKLLQSYYSTSKSVNKGSKIKNWCFLKLILKIKEKSLMPIDWVFFWINARRETSRIFFPFTKISAEYMSLNNPSWNTRHRNTFSESRSFATNFTKIIPNRSTVTYLDESNSVFTFWR